MRGRLRLGGQGSRPAARNPARVVLRMLCPLTRRPWFLRFRAQMLANFW
jgi:hypothetical protein